MKTRVMFVNAVDPTREGEVYLPPLGLGYLASYLRKEFGSDSINFKIVNRNVEREIESFKPDLVGITSQTQNYARAVEYAQTAKRYEIPVVVGGPHISMLPSSLADAMDVGVVGEGERTMAELFELFERAGGFPERELEGVDGIVFRNGCGKLVFTKKRAPIEPLDEIPPPARDLLGIGPYTSMITSRGCPYRCVYCVSTRFWGGRVRFHSAEYVVDEIREMVEEYGVKTINIFDDNFLLDRKRVRKIIRLLEEEDLLERVYFECMTRADFVDEESVLLLKRMGVRYVQLGLESGNPETLRYLKGDVKVENNKAAVEFLKRAGMECGASFIIGAPEETEEDILETLRFVKESPLERFGVYVLLPYPGTPLWELAKERRLVDENMDFGALSADFARNKRPVILSEKVSEKRLRELYSQFQKELKKRRVKVVVLKGLKSPGRIPRFLVERALAHLRFRTCLME